MGILKYILTKGPGSPGNLTKGICETYKRQKSNNRDLKLSDFFYNNANNHFPPIIVECFQSLYLEEDSSPSFYTYCYFYVMSYNYNQLDKFSENKKLISEIIVNTIQNQLPEFKYNYKDKLKFLLVHNNLLLSKGGRLTNLIAVGTNEFY